MTRRVRARWLVVAGGVLMGAPPALAQGGGLPPSTIEVAGAGGVWTVAWDAARAPATTDAGRWPALAPGGASGRVAPGVRVDRYALRGTGEAFRTELVVVRLHPDSVRFTLDTAFAGSARAWQVDRAPAGAVMAVNAGQFVADLPWGWVQLGGRQWLPPGAGPLVTTVVLGDSGVRLLARGARPAGDRAPWAFQSYPTLVTEGRVPPALLGAGGGVDVAHRDARLALGRGADGTILVAMTRFGALGGALDGLPFGLTTPEMAGVMLGLGATDAVLLDGGISAQLLVRRSGGVTALRLPGLRRVPLALLAWPADQKPPRK